MNEINLQEKTFANIGSIEMYWFENKNIGLEKTLYHRIYIPLKAFDSGIKHEIQPIKTEIIIEWLRLNLKNPVDLNGIKLTSKLKDDVEVSIYIGSAHNLCEIIFFELKQIENNIFEVKGKLDVFFEFEKVAKNEKFEFNTQLVLNENIIC